MRNYSVHATTCKITSKINQILLAALNMGRQSSLIKRLIFQAKNTLHDHESVIDSK